VSDFLGILPHQLINRLIQTVAMNYATLTAGRCIAGVGTGILSSTAPMYISEVAPPNIRGALLVLEQFAIVFGIVVMYFIVRISRTMCYKDSLHPQDIRNPIHR
jgi:MFS family permease